MIAIQLTGGRCAKRGSGISRLPYRRRYSTISATPCSAAPRCASTGVHHAVPKKSEAHAPTAHTKKNAADLNAKYASCVQPGTNSEANQSHADRFMGSIYHGAAL